MPFKRQGEEPAASFVAFLVDASEPADAGELAAGCVLFILQERDFGSPPEWHLKCIIDWLGWYNSVMAEIHVALAPAAKRAN